MEIIQHWKIPPTTLMKNLRDSSLLRLKHKSKLLQPLSNQRDKTSLMLWMGRINNNLLLRL